MEENKPLMNEELRKFKKSRMFATTWLLFFQIFIIAFHFDVLFAIIMMIVMMPIAFIMILGIYVFDKKIEDNIKEVFTKIFSNNNIFHLLILTMASMYLNIYFNFIITYFLT